MEQYLQSIEVEKKSGEEFFHTNDDHLPFQLLDFWQWYASDLNSNRIKGILAEFLVAKALKCAIY